MQVSAAATPSAIDTITIEITKSQVATTAKRELLLLTKEAIHT